MLTFSRPEYVNADQPLHVCVRVFPGRPWDLLAAVEEHCADFTMTIYQHDYTFSVWVDHMQYSIGLSYLTDADSGGFCLDVEKT